MGFKRKKTLPSIADSSSKKLITYLNPQSQVSEQYRTIRTNTLFSFIDQSIHSLVVTSTVPGEGKSTTISNLAVVFAGQGKKVLLVDADMRKPALHNIFKLTNQDGLTNVLAKQISFKEAYRETAINNLFILTSGPIPPNPAELLSSAGMKSLILESKTSFDYILFDTPPVLALTDPQILANQCDGTILIVNSGKIDIAKSKKAKELLLNAKARLLGVVLNNYNPKEVSYYYPHN